MRRYVIRRLIQAVFLLWLISMGMFALIHAIPGGPERVLISPTVIHGNAAYRAALIHKYGLDRPLPIQYWSWLTQVLRGNLGISITDNQSVASDVFARFPATIELFAAALGLALVVAVPVGVLAAVRQYSITDYALTVFAYGGISMPIFWFGLILQEFFGVQLHLLPIFGRTSPDQTGFTTLQIYEDYAIHLILPTIVLSLLFIAGWSRYLRSSMLETVKQDYIRTARAKGLSARAIFFRHALRNALIPFVTVVAIDFGGIAGGAVITETVFAWPGVGYFFFDALNDRNYPVLMAMLMIGAASVITFNLIADVLYGVIDPRIRYS